MLQHIPKKLQIPYRNSADLPYIHTHTQTPPMKATNKPRTNSFHGSRTWLLRDSSTRVGYLLKICINSPPEAKQRCSSHLLADHRHVAGLSPQRPTSPRLCDRDSREKWWHISVQRPLDLC